MGRRYWVASRKKRIVSGGNSSSSSRKGLEPFDLLILPACWAARSPSPGRVWRPPTLPTSSEACIRPLCIQYLAIGWPLQHSLWAISFSWCGKTRSRPPPWMSKVRPSRRRLMAEHSMCQPGRPGPQGLSHDGSPGLAPFQRAKSAGVALPLRHVAPFALHRLRRAVAELAVVRVLAHVEIDVAVGRGRRSPWRSASAVKSMISSMLSVRGGSGRCCRRPAPARFRM